MHNIRIIFISLFWLLATHVAQAETIYVIDELKIGLHEEPSINRPIMKLVPSGTELSVIDRNEDLVHVQEPEGIQGWISNKYVVADKPAKARVHELEKEIALLKSTTTSSNAAESGTDTQKQLEQQLKSERLKSGVIQAKLTELKAKIANVDNSEQFLADIEQLKQENERLILQLASSGIEVQSGSTTNDHSLFLNGWKQFMTIFIILFVIGMAAGAFVLDHLSRRRHGGFRI